jgi:membrane associated rhomboid family serine protease
MLLAPSEKPFDYRKPPRLSLGLAALLLMLSFWLFPADEAHRRHLNETYAAELLNVEWPLYPPFLSQTGKALQLKPLEEARAAADTDRLTQQLGYDRAFVDNLYEGGKAYLDAETFSRWSESRNRFDAERNLLSSQILGLDPQRFRPVTFISHALTDTNLYSVLLSVIVLLLVGMAAEWMMGSGALLTAWLAGSISGGLVFWITHTGTMTPLTGSAHASAAVLGLAAWQFRHRGSLRLMDSALTLGGWIIAALAVAVVGMQIMWHQFDLRWAVSMLIAVGSGVAVAIAHHHWFLRQEDETEFQPVEESQTNETYRQDLNQVMVKLSQMQFVAAEKNIRSLLERYPEDKRLLEQLYHLLKLNPSSLEFEEVAFSMLTLPNRPESNHVSLRIYRDYLKRSQTFVAMDDNTGLQLVLRFTRIGALREAEDIFKRVLESNRQAPLLAKAAAALSQACAAKNQEQRASYYASLVKGET